MSKPALLKKGLRHLHVLQTIRKPFSIVSKPALLKKGLLRAEPSGHPEGVQAPEGSPTIRGGCLANARQDRCSRRDCDNLAGKKN